MHKVDGVNRYIHVSEELSSFVHDWLCEQGRKTQEITIYRWAHSRSVTEIPGSCLQIDLKENPLFNPPFMFCLQSISNHSLLTA